MARKFSAMQIISIEGNTDLKGIFTQEELAYYLVLGSLATLSRAELRESVITNSSILSMLEVIPETSNIFDNYMMGRY